MNAGSFLLMPMPIGNGISALSMQYSGSCGMIFRSGYCCARKIASGESKGPTSARPESTSSIGG